jgi:FkbM family methyltransferase
MKLYQIPILRKITLPLLKAIDFDMQYNHPWIKNNKIKLSLFKHKGYWYHGKRREKKSMILFQKIIQPNHTIAEVGGHIGFISLWFNELAKNNGKVFVFEPGSNNLPYIKNNTKKANRITLIEKAIGSEVGIVSFYEDNLTGQNNSIVKDFDGFKENSKFSFVDNKIEEKSVPLTTIDHELKNEKIDFIKIDIEGGEYPAIIGATQTIAANHPAMMIEIQANENELYEYLINENYLLFNENLHLLTSPMMLKSNVFCLHKYRHQQLITELFPSL